LYNGIILFLTLPRADLDGPVHLVLQGLPKGVTLTGASLDGQPLTVGQTASGAYQITLDASALHWRGPLAISVTFSDLLGLPIRSQPEVFTEENGDDEAVLAADLASSRGRR